MFTADSRLKRNSLPIGKKTGIICVRVSLPLSLRGLEHIDIHIHVHLGAGMEYTVAATAVRQWAQAQIRRKMGCIPLSDCKLRMRCQFKSADGRGNVLCLQKGKAPWRGRRTSQIGTEPSSFLFLHLPHKSRRRREEKKDILSRWHSQLHPFHPFVDNSLPHHVFHSAPAIPTSSGFLLICCTSLSHPYHSSSSRRQWMYRPQRDSPSSMFSSNHSTRPTPSRLWKLPRYAAVQHLGVDPKSSVFAPAF